MQKSERSSFTVLDFQGWEESEGLSLAPKFQRRSVWKLAARTYLVETLLKGMPTPPIYLRVTQNEKKTKTVREVIDGQQRLRAILDFAKDDFALSKSVSEVAPGKRFSQLTEDQQDALRKYSFSCESFSSISDAEVLEVFARMNTYSVKLNAQELRNGLYFGPFKRTCYRLAHEHLEFWRTCKIFSDSSIARMLEVEFVSELVIMGIDGLQDKKKSIDSYYRKFDDGFPDDHKLQERFRATIDAISSVLPDTSLSKSEFHRPPLFYSLYSVVYHRLFGMPKIQLASNKSGKLTRDDTNKLKDTLLDLSERIQAARDSMEPVQQRDSKFIEACLRQTDNLRPRDIRFKTIFRRAFGR